MQPCKLGFSLSLIFHSLPTQKGACCEPPGHRGRCCGSPSRVSACGCLFSGSLTQNWGSLFKNNTKKAVQPADERKAVASLAPTLRPIARWAVQQSSILLVHSALCSPSAGAEPLLVYIYYFYVFPLVWWASKVALLGP